MMALQIAVGIWLGAGMIAASVWAGCTIAERVNDVRRGRMTWREAFGL